MSPVVRGVAPPSASRQRALAGAIKGGALAGAVLGLRREYFCQEERDGV